MTRKIGKMLLTKARQIFMFDNGLSTTSAPKTWFYWIKKLQKERCVMVSLQQIEEFGRRIGKEFRPQRVILFGSFAQGRPTPDSDVDLLIITEFEGRPVDKSVEIRLKVRPPFPVDLIVRTPEKVRERLAMGDSFMKEILAEGKVLYEADHD
ncbi:MAG: nucleotidyltransferase domain-containing protein [bacterium]